MFSPGHPANLKQSILLSITLDKREQQQQQTIEGQILGSLRWGGGSWGCPGVPGSTKKQEASSGKQVEGLGEVVVVAVVVVDCNDDDLKDVSLVSDKG